MRCCIASAMPEYSPLLALPCMLYAAYGASASRPPAFRQWWTWRQMVPAAAAASTASQVRQRPQCCCRYRSLPAAVCVVDAGPSRHSSLHIVWPQSCHIGHMYASCPSSLCRAVPCGGGRCAGRPAAAAGRGHGRSGCHPAPRQYPLCVAAGGELAWVNAAAVAWSSIRRLADAARCRAGPAALTAQQHSMAHSQLPCRLPHLQLGRALKAGGREGMLYFVFNSQASIGSLGCI